MRPLVSAEIIAVGTEMLTPFRIDTNSLFLSARLNEIGIEVLRKSIVGDRMDDLVTTVANACFRSDVVIITGGLGPTADDLTREAVAAALNLRLREDPEILEGLKKRFAKRASGAMPENNRRQAQVLDGAVVLANPNGSAPGLWIDRGEKAVILLPGPPREMEPMFETHVGPKLARRTGARRLQRRVIKIAGQAESLIDEIASPIYVPFLKAAVPIETTVLAHPGQVELHLSAAGDDQKAIAAALAAAVESLTSAIGESVFSTDGRSIESVVGDALKARALTIGVAESCTGGLVAGRLTDVPGSSAYVRGGVMAYSNGVKSGTLGVPAELIAQHGAVSEPVALAMAEGVRRTLGADVGVAVTGIAGPDGGTPEKPVGTVWFAVAGPEGDTETYKRVVPGDRQVVRAWAVMVALDLVRRALR
ncbi:MAG: competence/damage-inducible protein A [Acidobacteria bacterium]|nr:MAG: competence/damage-inducible protein A [Acidobacteriota bacterium]